MKRLFPLLFLVCLLSAPVWSADNVLPKPDGEEGFIYFTSEEASADPAAKKVNLQGDVTIVQHTKEGFARTAKGEDITLDQANTTVSSVGPMQVETESGTSLRSAFRKVPFVHRFPGILHRTVRHVGRERFVCESGRCHHASVLHAFGGEADGALCVVAAAFRRAEQA